MNQDQVKKGLLKLEPDTEEFSVIFSGKESRKVNGLYHPDKREIIIHNKNFTDDNDLMYTAIHEFAHHLHFTRSPVPISAKAHTMAFWSIFHGLLEKAESAEVYRNVFDSNKEFRALTRTIKEDFLAKNGALMKEFAELLIKADELCKKTNMRFDDYVDRTLGVPRLSARALIRMRAFNVNPAIGFDNMKVVASLPDEESRRGAQAAFLAGKSPDSVKAEFGRRREPKEPSVILEEEKRRIERTISSLTQRLGEINARLERLQE
jgi:hypothetical protein